MSFWSGERLIENPSVIEGFSQSSVDTNAYNLHMGDCYFRTSDGSIQTKQFLKEKEAFAIPAGQFAFLLTKETIRVPSNAMAFISVRTGIKFQGLINVSGFHVDPGYRGKLVYAVYNASPATIQICEGDAIFKIWFADLDRTSSVKHKFTGAGQTTISNDLIRGMSREIYSLQSVAEQIREQKPVIDNLAFVWRAIVLTVIGAIIVALLSVAWPSLKSAGDLIHDKLFGSSGSNMAAPAQTQSLAKP